MLVLRKAKPNPAWRPEVVWTTWGPSAQAKNEKSIMRMFLTAETRGMIAGLLLAVAASLPAVAADLYVPTTNYPSIQAAVNAAQTNDTIHIAPGVYTEQVEIVTNTLTLIGQPGTILRATTNMTGHAGASNIPIIVGGSSK